MSGAALWNLLAKLFDFTYNLSLGVVFGALGLALAAWVGASLYRVEFGFDLAIWALGHSPLELTAPIEQLANESIQPNSQIAAGVLGAFLCWIAFQSLRGAGRAFRPAGASGDAKVRLALKTAQPRVGLPLKGSLLLASAPKHGQIFRLTLTCHRRYLSGESERTETAFQAMQDVQAVQAAEGWQLPFAFDVPATAPPSATGRLQAGEGFHWSLEYFDTNAFLAFPSSLGLTLAPAPAEELRATEVSETAEQKAAIDALERVLSPTRTGPLLPHERAQLRALSPDRLAQAGRITDMSADMIKGVGTLMKWLLIGFFLIPAVAVLFFVVAALLRP